MTPIDDRMFNREELESEKFIGEIVAFEIREGSKGKAVGQDVLYMEVANLTRPLPWGNYVREVFPAPGKFTYWTQLIGAFEDKLNIKLNNTTIPTIKEKFKYLWWVAISRENKVTGKSFTDIFPQSVPTKEEIAKALEGSEEEVDPDTGEIKQGEVITPQPSKDDEAKNLVLSIIDGLTAAELKTQAKEYNMSPEEAMKAAGLLMVAGKVKMENKKYKVQK